MPADDSNAHLLRAVQRATRTLARTDDISVLLRDVLAICVKAVGAQGGTIYVHDATKKCLRFEHVLPEHVADKIQFTDMPDNEGVAGEVFQTRQTRIGQSGKDRSSETGVVVKSMITVPLMMEDEEPIGVVQLINKEDGEFVDEDVTVLDTVAAVSTMAYLNSRLVEESTRASTLLGMGKVGHDIGNLAASLFATHALGEYIVEMLAEQFSPEALGELVQKPDELEKAITRIVEQLNDNSGDLRRSIQRIVGYSRLISDLSAGRSLRPEMELGSVALTVKESAAYLENDARQNCVEMRYEVAEDAPEMNRDELFIFRIVQNLVGNAIKAVRENIPDERIKEDAIEGTVTVRYYYDGSHVIEVCDTGSGMSQDVVEQILGGNARSKWKTGGSGWGTKIVKELAHSHGANLEIDSEIAKGSTFRVRFPQ